MENEILSLLESRPGESLSAEQIATYLDLDPNKARGVLRNLSDAKAHKGKPPVRYLGSGTGLEWRQGRVQAGEKSPRYAHAASYRG